MPRTAADAPLYVRIADALRDAIAQGRYPVGSRLPSEATLRAEFGTSRGPVRQALDVLRAEGRVEIARGAAARVVDHVPTQPFESLVSFTEWAQSLGREPGQRTLVLERVAADADIAGALGIEVGEGVIRVVRLRSMDGAPMMLERSIFVADAGQHLFTPGFDPDAGSIYQHLRASGIELYRGRHLIDATAASDEDAALLDITPGSPLLRVRRTVADRAGRVLETADDHYLPELTVISIQNTADRPTSSLSLLPHAPLIA